MYRTESVLHRSRATGLSRFSTFQKEDVDLEFVECLMNSKAWTMFSVSHLFNLDMSEKNMRFYNKRLREIVSQTLKHDTLAEVSSEMNIQKGFDLTVYDTEAINITVTVEELETVVKTRPKVVTYTGYMFSRGQMESQGMKPQLPILLCQCKSVNLINNVHSCLAALFDCCITKFEFRASDLQWLLAVLLEAENEINSIKYDLTLTYSPYPHSKNTVDIGLSMLVLQKVWNSIRGANKGVVDTVSSEVESLISTVTHQMLHMFSMHTQRMILTKISSPFGIFLSNGKVIFKSAEISEVVLRFLTVQLLFEEKYNTRFIDETVKL